MNNYKIKVNDGAESKEVQELFFALGYMHKWDGAVVKESWTNARIVYAEDGILWSGNCSDDFAECDFPELTLPQLRDLVAQSKAKVREYLDPYDNYKLCLINPSDVAHWMIEVPEKAEFLLKWQANHPTFYRNKYGERYNSSYKQWDLVDGDEGIKEMICLWSREPTQEQCLISGADALRALADGKEIQWVSADFKNWNDLDIWNANLKTFLNEKYIAEGEFKFRLKPRTIKIELEIPAPFEPQEFEDCYMLTDLYEHGYTKTSWKYKSVPAWRTEEEIKQVVAALRGGIKA